jgi:hypothetical protein
LRNSGRRSSATPATDLQHVGGVILSDFGVKGLGPSFSNANSEKAEIEIEKVACSTTSERKALKRWAGVLGRADDGQATAVGVFNFPPPGKLGLPRKPLLPFWLRRNNDLTFQLLHRAAFGDWIFCCNGA